MTICRTEQLVPLLSPWIETLLTHERTIVPQAAGMRERAFSRARALLAVPENPTLFRPSGSAWQRILFGSAAGVGLVATAALVHLPTSHHPSATPSTLIDFPSAENKPPSSPPSEPSPDEDSPQGTAATQAPSAEHRTAQATEPAPPLDELEMLERAQKADARGDFSTVLAIAAQHERLYPTGQLSEEREILRLRALIGLGRGHEAQQAVRKFRRDYPRSVLLPTLNQMLATTL